ncbi:MAG: MFS transporter [Nitrososphaerota archaeon]|nr:MFS transporter [Nitrososphaerota archaeon]
MVQYKWVVLSNTTLGVLMSSIDSTIVLISLPAIFRGIQLDPMTSFQYLIWILFGYMIVTATLLVTFGRISDMYGRVRLYNLGFAIFAVGSTLLYLTPNTGNLGALEIIFFRMIQAVGASFLFSNSAALITDAFPEKELGKALGINQIAGLAGSFIGLVVGGTLATIYWRYVFLVSVPVGVFGAIWSYWKLKEIGVVSRGQKIDVWGNITFAAGLTILLISLTYGLLPYRTSSMGWSDPYVVAGLIVSAALLVSFPFIEGKVRYPMFRLSLFKIRTFSAGIFAGFLASAARGGVMIMLSILLQGIWLPLHGINYVDTPFWAGIYLLPLSAGFITMGPISGWLSDKYGARGLSTLGMVITAGTFLVLAALPYNFYYTEFAFLIYVQGVGMGMFASPNTASVMDSVPEEHRGAAAGMRSTMQNTGMMVSISVFFAVIVFFLSNGLPGAFASALAQAGAPSQVIPYFTSLSPTEAMFSAFLGYNPVAGMIATLPSSVTSLLSSQTISILTGLEWFPTTIAHVFMSSLQAAFYVSAGLSILAAVASSLRGKESRARKPIRPAQQKGQMAEKLTQS